jgi:hypothetical protein
MGVGIAMTVFSKMDDLDCLPVSRSVVARKGTCYDIQPFSGLIPAAEKRLRMPTQYCVHRAETRSR